MVIHGHSYFTLRIKGAKYGIWQDHLSQWHWGPVNGAGWGYTDETNAHVQSICDVLNKTDEYAGLTPQQFVEKILK